MVGLHLFLMVFLSAIVPAYADTYHYEGADGTIVFTDDASKIPRKPGKMKLIPDGRAGKPSHKRDVASAQPETSPKPIRQESPEIHRSRAYYEVGGYTFRDVRREIYYRSPKRSGKNVAVAWCRWAVSWKIETRQEGSLCQVHSVDTQADIAITMPRWVNYASAGDGMKASWDTYYKSVLEHEENHGDHGIAAAREIQRRLPELTGRSSCKDLQEDGKLLAHKIIKGYEEKDEAFDQVSLNADMITDVEIAADQREGVLGRQYPGR